MRSLAECCHLNLRAVNANSLLKAFLPRILPPAWRGKAAVAWDQADAAAPSAAWIVLLWRRLQVAPFSCRLLPSIFSLPSCKYVVLSLTWHQCSRAFSYLLNFFITQDLLRRQAFHELASFSGWPLLPTLAGELAALPALEQSVLVWADGEWEQPFISALKKLRLR